MDLFSPTGKRSETRPVPPRSRMGRLWAGTKFIAGSPVATAGLDEVARGGRLIRSLAAILRHGPGADPRLRTDAVGRIDIAATAIMLGITVEDLEQLILKRQRQTARSAYVFLAFGAALLPVWLYLALSYLPMTKARITSAFEFLPFCAVLFLMAFKSAWMNWQLRTRRLGSAAAYLRTTDPFLPR